MTYTNTPAVALVKLKIPNIDDDTDSFIGNANSVVRVVQSGKTVRHIIVWMDDLAPRK